LLKTLWHETLHRTCSSGDVSKLVKLAKPSDVETALHEFTKRYNYFIAIYCSQIKNFLKSFKIETSLNEEKIEKELGKNLFLNADD
jgi:hypothetical protein